jgi:hypothetical protein
MSCLSTPPKRGGRQMALSALRAARVDPRDDRLVRLVLSSFPGASSGPAVRRVRSVGTQAGRRVV